MTIPTINEFSELTEIANSYDVYDLIRRVSKIQLKPQEIKPILIEGDKRERKLRQEINKTPCAKWLDYQPSFRRAEKAINTSRGGKLISLDDWIEMILKPEKDRTLESESWWLNRKQVKKKYPTKQAQIDYINHQNSPEMKRKRIRHKIEYSLRESDVDWIGLVSHELKEYFYGDMWNSNEYSVQEFERACKEAIKGLNALERLRKLEKFTDYKAHSNAFGKLERHILRLESISSPGGIEALPIRRVDRTTKERWLVYRLYRGFERILRKPKTNAIYHVLSLEGIEHQLELRTIERLVQGWRRSRKALYRQLNEQNPESSNMLLFR